ncbi:DUF1349 domain-containing protein [Aestuariimicrobium sp. T2.26MG-19.2B]|uniref:DUF1349 domain-containing protein n=1 Tax=Aestuariimicrobium sp. T2.26MG-19.2B TaxID=3040679 RepID=UPI0024777298|nr:DUF1349 domain-containing protein [Aestuariimicrobium sp. T2.26MG-19.2B]CAI9401511.1 hypothetical protein AESSP_00607 [Aestuariimicrobium sp. T2.26MG-19.2B]
MTQISVPGVPFALEQSEPWPWQVNESGVAVTAKPTSDLFVDPRGEETGDSHSAMNAVTLLGTPTDGDFTLTARVRVDFLDTFDAGVLLAWADEAHWAKLCFEYSPQGQPMVVSVVTRGVSDDANSSLVDGNVVWLRLSRVGRVLALHSSTDGQTFSFVRVFHLGDAPIRVGFEAQSPTGRGCAVEFTEVSFTSRTLDDLRDGS